MRMKKIKEMQRSKNNGKKKKHFNVECENKCHWKNDENNEKYFKKKSELKRKRKKVLISTDRKREK